MALIAGFTASAVVAVNHLKLLYSEKFDVQLSNVRTSEVWARVFKLPNADYRDLHIQYDVDSVADETVELLTEVFDAAVARTSHLQPEQGFVSACPKVVAAKGGDCAVAWYQFCDETWERGEQRCE